MTKQDTPIVIDALFKVFTATSSDIIHLNDERGNILYSNQASEDLLGYSQEELLHKPAAFVVHPDDQARVGGYMRSILDNNPIPPQEIRLRRKDDTYLEVEVQGFLVPSEQGRFIGAIIRDVSRRKALERQRIQFTDTLLQSQLATTLDGILVVGPDNKILLSNACFQEMWNIDPQLIALHDDEMALKTIVDQVTNPEGFLGHIHYLLKHPEEKSLDVIYLKDGRIFERYSSPLFSGAEEHLGRIWYFRDITKAKRQEEEVLKMKKLESVGVLAGGIAHDFSNLLSGILGNVELASFYVDPENKALELLHDAKEACLRAHVLTQQLITFSKGGMPIKEKTRLQDIVQACWQFSEPDPDVQCNVFMDEDLWPLKCDSAQIRQVLESLLANAGQAMPEGGVIDIRCQNSHYPGNSKLAAGDYLQITIADNGVGISAQNIGNIFDPYFTTRKMGANKGTGLGLAIVHSIVEKHEGSIEVASVEGEGATFTLLLPASREVE